MLAGCTGGSVAGLSCQAAKPFGLRLPRPYQAVFMELAKPHPTVKLLYVTPEQLVKGGRLKDALQALDRRVGGAGGRAGRGGVRAGGGCQPETQDPLLQLTSRARRHQRQKGHDLRMQISAGRCGGAGMSCGAGPAGEAGGG